ncbi:MAG: bifunctional demethylmenaquinone methyltransferase/2-methoxy-6-polyprenyl-1,4-benzoquinol methylase UbiE [Crocinitomicaceae bacterium]|nr:bifunctional demethylmenaquinone methyltransferase/2-methoxy-6-polyprenyl-1,4-benzoquinol methylase UbiE [Crocinitomicaceae bacterium]
MFDNISQRYDFLNHFLSLGIDNIWRKKAVKILKEYQPKLILDIATGTGDFAISALRIKPTKVIGLDLSAGMLEVGRKKMKKKGLQDKVEMVQGDSENLPYEDDHFDGITVGFGVRNFENLEKGLSEMRRVLKPGAPAIILEFSKPKRFPVKQSFNFYSKYIIPKVGRSISKDKAAYSYLPESVEAFPEGQAFIDIMDKVGFKNLRSKQVSGGIATIYVGEK